MSSKHLRILKEVVDLPTAPFIENNVIAYIRDFVSRRPQLGLQADRFGNLLVRYQPSGRAISVRRPLVFAAHMDHPGFAATRMVDASHVEAEFRGWVSSSFFDRERIQFFSDGRWVPGVITEVLLDQPKTRLERRARVSADTFRDQNPPRSVIARVKTAVQTGSPGMWRLPDARVRGHLLHTRACDDLAGLAGVLCMLDEICRRKTKTPCCAFFTRAEEVGFAGALAAVEDRSLPKESVVIAVECSKAITGVAFGDGPVLRVGDRASVFTPAATAYCQVVAEELAKRDKTFRIQRKLMDGGTCESTAYCHYGYDATGICLPLGNYHNMDFEKQRIGPEFIDVRDFENLVKWFVAIAESPATMKYDNRHPGLSKRLDDLLKKNRPRLLATVKASR
jgi:putative aminopeptidase FrvX